MLDCNFGLQKDGTHSSVKGERDMLYTDVQDVESMGHFLGMS